MNESVPLSCLNQSLVSNVPASVSCYLASEELLGDAVIQGRMRFQLAVSQSAGQENSNEGGQGFAECSA